MEDFNNNQILNEDDFISEIDELEEGIDGLDDLEELGDLSDSAEPDDIATDDDDLE